MNSLKTQGGSGVSQATLGGDAPPGSLETGLIGVGGNHAGSFAAGPGRERCFPDRSGEEL